MDNIERIEQQLKEQEAINNQMLNLMGTYMKQINQMKMELVELQTQNKIMKNLKYEILDASKENVFFPQFREIDDTIEDIVENRKSLVRFGDGDFGILFLRERKCIKYQSLNKELSKRLEEVLHARHPKLLVGIADNYGTLEQYTDEAADGIRDYMTDDGIREAHEAVLERDRVYENAYISRPYFMYRDNQTDGPRKRFDALRRIWKGRKVILIEGAKTRMGVGNDLLDGVEELKRILAPAENAFDKYDDILKAALRYAQNDTLFLVILGSTAEALVYDLTLSGYQAVDIGQVDIEYEWFLAGKGERVPVPYKYNNEVDGGENVEEYYDAVYEEQILLLIE